VGRFGDQILGALLIRCTFDARKLNQNIALALLCYRWLRKSELIQTVADSFYGLFDRVFFSRFDLLRR